MATSAHAKVQDCRERESELGSGRSLRRCILDQSVWRAAHQPGPSVVPHHVELRDGLVVLAQVDEHVVVRGEEREALGLVR